MESGRKVDFWLGIGILVAPYALSWFTLARGYSTLTRSICIGWALLFILVFSAHSGNYLFFVFVATISIYLIVYLGKKNKAESAQADAEMQAIISSPLEEIRPTKALIKSDEKAFAAIPAKLQEMQTVGYRAGTSGVSVRVVKGLTLRSGAIKGGAVKGAVIVSSGELVITDRRVIFAGDAKSFAINNDKLISTTNYTDGFGFSDSDKTYTLITESEKDRVKFAIALHKVLRA